MTDWLFVSDIGELVGLTVIILLASVVRGAIGFGFSALVVASSSFWLPPIAVVAMVVILEIVASIAMLPGIRGDINYRLLTPLTLGTIPGSLVGVTLLTLIEPLYLQLIMGTYLFAIALTSLLDVKLKTNPGLARISSVGVVAGFYGGLAGMGGLLIATFLSSSQITVKNIRATMVVYFLFCEAIFLLGAYLNDVYTPEIFITSLIAILPMIIGIQIGTHLFKRLSEQVLRQGVLVALMVISIIGLLKYL